MTHEAKLPHLHLHYMIILKRKKLSVKSIHDFLLDISRIYFYLFCLHKLLVLSCILETSYIILLQGDLMFPVAAYFENVFRPVTPKQETPGSH